MKFFFIPSFLCCFFLIGNSVFAQFSSDEVVRETLMISIKKHGEQNSKYQLLVDEKVRNFNIKEYITENVQYADIQIVGSKISYGKTVKINFDSKKLDWQNDCNQICKSIVNISKIPVMGLTISPMNDLQGVLVETIYEGSAADIAGIQPGDMITFVSDSIIQSGCDMTESIEEVEVGEVLDIFIEEEGKQKILPLILGYKIEEITTYEYCCDSEMMKDEDNDKAEIQFSIFPNPTDGIAQLKFRSSGKTDLKISLTDVAGHHIFKTEVKDFDGFYNEVLDLTDYAAGLYFIQIMQGRQVWTEKIVLQNL